MTRDHHQVFLVMKERVVEVNEKFNDLFDFDNGRSDVLQLSLKDENWIELKI